MRKWGLGISLVACVLFAITYLSYKSTTPSFCAKGELIVVNKLGRSISAIDLNNQQKTKTYNLGIEPHECLVYPEKNIIIVSDFGKKDQKSNELYILSSEKFELLKTLNVPGHHQLHGLSLTPFPNVILVCSESSNSLLSINVQSGVIESEVNTQGVGAHMIISHPDKSIAYVSNIYTHNVSVIDYKNDSLIAVIPCGKGSEGLCLSKDGEELWVSNMNDHTITVINTATLEAIHTIETGKKPVRISMSPDGKYCVSSNFSDGSMSVFDVNSKQLIKIIKLPGSTNVLDRLFNKSPTPAGLTFHPAKPFLFVSNSNADQAVVISTDSWEVMGSWKVGDMPDGIAFNNKNNNCD